MVFRLTYFVIQQYLLCFISESVCSIRMGFTRLFTAFENVYFLQKHAELSSKVLDRRKWQTRF